MKQGFYDVIMPAYNVELYIAESIDSILAQTYENIEVFVIYDGSTDRTIEVVVSRPSTVPKVVPKAVRIAAVVRSITVDSNADPRDESIPLGRVFFRRLKHTDLVDLGFEADRQQAQLDFVWPLVFEDTARMTNQEAPGRAYTGMPLSSLLGGICPLPRA